ncbi:hypothetical protein BMS3Bbin01_02283 [bacterium BMS3Bbin01]|nr:hypothetical protein BMS3Bbin01_02283 [bacterium BMS3Bbin01]
MPSLRGDGGVAARLLYPIPLAALGYFPCEGKEEVGSFFASATSCLCFSLEGEVPSLRGDGGVAARLLYPIPLAALGYFPCEGKQEVGSFLASATSCLCFPLQGEVPSLRGDGGVAARILYPIPLAALGHFPCEEEGGGQLKFSRRVVDEACEVLEGRGGVRGSTVTVGP